MKKIMSLMLGLSLAMGAVSLFASDDKDTTKKESKKKKGGKKKTAETK